MRFLLCWATFRLRRDFSFWLLEGEMEATRVTVDEIKERMNRGEQFTFVDTRNPKAWDEAETKLPGAIRVPANEVEKHISEIPRDRTVITYCT